MLANTEIGPRIAVGYSVKTSPTDQHLRIAKEMGFHAECITQKEVHRALAFGFKPEEVILNGPGKFWPLGSPPVLGLQMLFCDSVEEFNRVILLQGISKTLGFRIRLPQVHSRFGNEVGDFDTFQTIVSSVRRLQKQQEAPHLGFHFHMPSWSIGVNRWMDALESLLLWCKSIQELTGVTVHTLDLGGGFFPDDLETLDFGKIQLLVGKILTGVQRLFFEPGRALTQESEILVSRVLDVRRRMDEDSIEIIVDACIAELPLAQSFPHRVFYRSASKSCIPLRKGSSRILGRICMEDDILCNQVELPRSIEIGDCIIFGDAGGYERSMSYEFGRG